MAVDDTQKTPYDGNPPPRKVKFEIYGQELIEKIVNSNGNSGRVYLPPEWIGTKVKVVKC